MAKLVLACWRSEHDATSLEGLVRRLAPDNLENPRIVDERVDPLLTLATLELAPDGRGPGWAMVGHSEDQLGPLGAPVPEGSFAGLRWSPEHVELLADAAGSRSLWYLETPALFAASTSQRALVLLSRSFEPNPQAMAWMLSSGTLGPGQSWDRRIRLLAPGAQLLFDRRRWTSRRSEAPVVFSADPLPAVQLHKRLQEAIEQTMSRCRFENGWVLPLSGGFDSRALLWALGRQQRLPCITWGTRAARQDPLSDAAVAEGVARRAQAPFRYLEIDPGGATADRVLERFVVAGEGRVDHVTGYLDGLLLWQRLREEGIRGIVRGDEGFGWLPAATSRKGRLSVGLAVFADYRNVSALRSAGVATRTGEPSWPRSLAREPGESVPTWRDRLYHNFRIPTILAALHELKAPFLEIANPFLAGRILEVVRQLPDELRTEKRLFREVAKAQDQWGPYAVHGANPSTTVLFDRPDFRQVLEAELSHPSATAVLEPSWLETMKENLARGPRSPTSASSGPWRSLLKRAVPLAWRQLAQDRLFRESLSLRTLCFRSYLILRVSRMLRADKDWWSDR